MICTDCPLHKSALTNCMPGKGPAGGILIVGQGPGGNEDFAGEPFIGKAGKLLRAMLAEAGIDPDLVRYTNATRCRTPQDRKPTPKEIEACRKHLKKEIHETQPEVIIALGDSALQATCKKSGITQKRGQPLALHSDFEYICEVWPEFHPAYVLRVPTMRDTVVAGFRSIAARKEPELEVSWTWWQGEDFLGAPLAYDIETDYNKVTKKTTRITQVAVAADNGVFVTQDRVSEMLHRLEGCQVIGFNSWAFDDLWVKDLWDSEEII